MKRLLILLLAAVLVSPLPLKAQDSAEFTDYLTHYYLSPAPTKAPFFLQQYLESDFFKTRKAFEEGGVLMTAYLFGRIALLDPAVLPEYEKIFDKASHDGRSLLLNIFQIGGNEKTRQFLEARQNDPAFAEEKDLIAKVLASGIPLGNAVLGKKIRDSEGLDLNWAEFMLTGNAEPVSKIIDVLDWPDRARHAIESFLASSESLETKHNLLDLLADFDIASDKAGLGIQTAEDLDVKISAGLMFGRGKRSITPLRQLLKMPDADVIHLATKGSAAWALESNAKQHPRVLEIIESEINTRQGASLIRLLQIAGLLETEKGNKALALEYLNKLVAMNPAETLGRHLLASIALEEGRMDDAEREHQALEAYAPGLAEKLEKDMKFKRVAELAAAECKPAQADTKAVMDLVAGHESAVKAYESRLTLRNYSAEALKDDDYVTMRWSFSQVLPDRFDVEQAANSGEADKWRTIGRQNYIFLGFWIKDPDSAEKIRDFKKVNRLLSLGKYYGMVRGKTPAKIETVAGHGAMLRLTFEKLKLPKDFAVKSKKGAALVLFIDQNTGSIAKAQLRFQGKAKGHKFDIAYDQDFIYDDTLTIEAPPQTPGFPS